jgi:hypothetical protein
MTAKQEGYLMLGIAALLLAGAIFGKGVRYGMPGSNKPVYAMNTGTRVVLAVFTVIFLVFGIADLMVH